MKNLLKKEIKKGGIETIVGVVVLVGIVILLLVTIVVPMIQDTGDMGTNANENLDQARVQIGL